MIHFLIGGAGCGKSHRLMKTMQEYVAEGRDVLAIVPEQFSYEFDRKLYGLLGAASFNALETHSFTSLARSIFQRFGGGQPGTYMDDLTQTGLVGQAVQLAEKELRFFQKQCHRTDFAAHAASILAVLRRSGITSEQLYEQCSSLTGRLLDKALDIALIYRQYEILLGKHHLKDMLTDITEAAAIANGNDFFAGRIVCVDEFESFTPDQYEMLTVICALADEVYFAMRMESDQETELSLFASVGAACRKIRSIASAYHIPVEFIHCTEQHRMRHKDLQQLSASVFRPMKMTAGEQSAHIHIFEARAPVDEAEYVCATIKRLLAQDDTLRCCDIAVVTNQLPEYAGVLEHAMNRYELPFHLDLAKPILHTPFMVYLTALFGLLSKKNPDTELLLRCGKSGYTDCDLMELSQLENYCYIWSIEGDTWNSPFTCGEDTAQIEAIRQKLLAPMQGLRAVCRGCETGADYSRAVYAFLEAQEIGRRAETLLCHPDAAQQMQMTQDFKRVWESLMDILDVLAFLYETQAMKSAQYFSVLQNLLHTVSHAVPPRTLDAVFIGPAGTSRLSEPKITFVLGACEGIFPGQISGDALFSERDRLQLEQCGISIGQPPELSAADERLAVYKILSSASEALYLCYPLTDSGDKKCSRSSVLDLALSLFENSRDMLVTQKQLTASYYAVTRQAAYYHYVQDFSRRNEDIAAIQMLLCKDDYYARRIDYLRQVHDDTDFTVQPQLMKQLVGNRLTLTASRLETFQMCPFHFFCQYALKLYERRKVSLRAAESGSLIHACLEQLLQNTPREQFLKMTEPQLAEQLRLLSERYWEENLGGDFSKNIRDVAALSRVTEGMTALATHMQEELRQSDFYPHYMELEVSDQNPDFPSPKLITASGHPVRIMGIADRVDLFHDGDTEWVRVVDYKSGGKKFALGNLLYGLDMQMLMYLFAITEPGTKLSHAKPAGVLYLPAGMPQCSAERGSGMAQEEILSQQYRMNGLLLEDVDLLRHMDHELAGKYISAKLLKNGTAFSKQLGSFLRESQMNQLRHYVTDKILETAEGIYSGDVSVSPLVLGERDACVFCTYKDVCGNGDQHKCRNIHTKSEELKQQLLDTLDGKEEKSHGMDHAAKNSD
ncbi:MAG: PD-(D/E)XK nuclease family protein [Ruminococcus sp.]|nr:PD-(D/E)XK nuclease family protein [Ruminococcus sp.]